MRFAIDGRMTAKNLIKNFIAFQRDFRRLLPAISTPFSHSKPTGVYDTVASACNAIPSLGSISISGQPYSYKRVVPKSIPTLAIGSSFTDRTVTGEDYSVYSLRNTRYHGYYGGNLITPDNHLIGELSPDIWGFYRHKLLSSFGLKSPCFLAGTTAVLSTPEADTNYSHWMVDFLPRLKALAENGPPVEEIDRYIVPSNHAAYAEETIKLAEIPKEKVHIVSPYFHCECEKIITTSIRKSHWRNSMPLWVPSFLQGLIPDLSEYVSDKNLSAIYLVRKNCPFRMVADEDLLISKLNTIGIKAIDPAEYSVAEQARTFRCSKLIISPHSSALTNLAFSLPDTVVLEIFPVSYFDSSFWTMASAVGADYYACFAEKGLGDVGSRRENMILGNHLIDKIYNWAAAKLQDLSSN